MNKGFTLIELLAVIVILAVIALIATPIVLSIINDTKESAVIRSAEFYAKAVENKIMQENMKLGGSLNPNQCIIGTDGNVNCDGTPLEIEVNGQKPNSGSITFNKGKVTNLTLIFGENTITLNENGEFAFFEVCQYDSNSSIPKNTVGAKYRCKVDPNKEAYNFYILSFEKDGSANLIMDRNICEDGTLTDATKTDKCTVAYNSSGDVTGVGPVTAMAYLNKATSSWSNISDLDITYNDAGNHFKNFKVTGKARLPYKSEVSDYNENNWYLYDYLHEGGHQKTTIYKVYGYWTLDSNIISAEKAYYIINEGLIVGNSLVTKLFYGVRPVINIDL